MKREIIRKRISIRLRKNDTAAEVEPVAGGDYFCDYSPRYTEEYSIYEKAKKHAKNLKKKK